MIATGSIGVVCLLRASRGPPFGGYADDCKSPDIAATTSCLGANGRVGAPLSILHRPACLFCHAQRCERWHAERRMPSPKPNTPSIALSHVEVTLQRRVGHGNSPDTAKISGCQRHPIPVIVWPKVSCFVIRLAMRSLYYQRHTTSGSRRLRARLVMMFA